jgi:Ser/Thr protein kinase RdoA (MazF antagonist)
MEKINKDFFDFICSYFRLENIIAEPVRINGGLTNSLFVIETSKGKFVIKVLNKNHIEKLNVIEFSEQISYYAKEKGIKSLPAKRMNGNFIQEYDGYQFLVYDYFEGPILLSKEIDENKCRDLARELAKLHRLDTDKIDVQEESKKIDKIDFHFYLEKIETLNELWAIDFKNNYLEIIKIYEKVFNSYKLLSNQRTFTHKDFNRKNVLWNENNFVIIDWETARYSNPSLDFFNSAWFLTEDVKENKYMAFASEYFKYFRFDDAIEVAVYAALMDELLWLEYSLKRALGIISNNESEILLGKEQVISSMKEVINYYSKINDMIRICGECLKLN